MGIERLTITAYKKEGCDEADKVKEFEVMLNPESYSRKYVMKDEVIMPIGAAGGVRRFMGIEPDSINLEFFFDGTGAIPNDKDQTVKEQLEEFQSVAFSYSGKIHRTNFLVLNWGELVVRTTLNEYTVDYTMFDPNGQPLRAKVKATFNRCIPWKEISAEAGNESPDLTHSRIVRQGDTLPGLCREIYDNPSYYPEVARFNNLGSFRNLKTGMKLYFPQIK